MRPALLLVVLLPSVAVAAPAALQRAQADLQAGRDREAAIAFDDALRSAEGEGRLEAELGLARALDGLGLRFGAFFHYASVLDAGPAAPQFAPAAAGAVAAAADLGDETVAPSLFDRLYDERLASALPPAPLAQIHSWLALLAYRAGRPGAAAQFASRVGRESPAFADAQYIAGLIQQRSEPERALQTFRAVAAMPTAAGDLRQLATLAVGRTLYGLHRYAEASAAYESLPRFSRHWDEALFEGAWADLRKGDPGSALGKLHSLHSPHLRDEFVPESLNLTAILFQQRCLYPRVRAALEQFDREYLPIRDALKKVLQDRPEVEEYWAMLSPSDPRLPPAAKQHLAKNERVASIVTYLARLAREEARLRGDGALSGTPLRESLLDAIAQQQLLVRRLGGRFIQGRLEDMARLIDLLEGDKELIAFEATKGEKEMLEKRFDPQPQLAAQRLARPALPQAGHEYWPFDGEYWPDEIGYYRYTVKDACPRSEER